jgi:hypothetical protein
MLLVLIKPMLLSHTSVAEKAQPHPVLLSGYLAASISKPLVLHLSLYLHDLDYTRNAC